MFRKMLLTNEFIIYDFWSVSIVSHLSFFKGDQKSIDSVRDDV